MSTLTVTVIDDAATTIGQYEISVLNSPPEAAEQRHTEYILNQIRIAAEIHKYYADFEEPNQLYEMSVPFGLDFDDPTKSLRGENVNALWLEIENLLRGARLNFSESRILKDIEIGYKQATPEDRNTRYDLHFHKMEHFYLAVFELARVEDLVVRLMFEFFGDDFIAVERTKKDWEKKLDWKAMKDALNKRGKPEKVPHPGLEAMPDEIYEAMMHLIRSYKTKQISDLTEFRNKRTHRVTPMVDYPELGVVISEAQKSGDAIMIPCGARRTKPEYEFLQLYETAKMAYKQLLAMLLGLNKIIHA